MVDIEELERLAKAATPGPWAVDEECLERHERLYVAKGSEGNLLGRILEVFENCLVRGKQRVANAEYIAAANPAAILELVAEVRQLREDLQASKLLAHANGEMFREQKIDNERMRCVLDVVRKHLMGWVSFEELHAALVKYETGPLQANIRTLATD